MQKQRVVAELLQEGDGAQGVVLAHVGIPFFGIGPQRSRDGFVDLQCPTRQDSCSQ